MSARYRAAAADALRGEELLIRGRLAEGFALYERRLDRGFIHEKFLAGYLRPGMPVSGRDVTVVGDEGFGDAIMFSRFVPQLATRGAHVTFVYKEALAPLFRTMGTVTHRPDTGSGRIFFVPGERGSWMLASSLPAFLGVDLADLDGRPYLSPPTGRPVIRRGGAPAIGLCWAGQMGNPSPKLAGRAIPLSLLLGAVPEGWRIVSLQKELQAGDAEILDRSGIERAGETFADFGDTAAAISQLDLVLTIDTAVAHLAGALGKPTWILLKADSQNADWRWFHSRDDSPWYDSARLFRQASQGDWAGLVPVVRRALDAHPLAR